MSDSMQDAAASATSEMTAEEGAVETPQVTSSEDASPDQAPSAKSEDAAPKQAPLKVDPLAAIDSLAIDDQLKQELKNGYLRQADYTKKTQEVAEVKKLADEYRGLQPFLEELAKDPYIQQRYLGQGEAQAQSEPEIPDDPAEFAKMVKEQTIAEMEQKMATQRDLDDAAAVDPRLNSDPKFAQIIAGLVAQDQAYIGGQKSAAEATQDAIASWQEYSQGIVQKTKTDLQARVLSKKMVTPQSGSPATLQRNTPLTIQEAARQAEEELGG